MQLLPYVIKFYHVIKMSTIIRDISWEFFPMECLNIWIEQGWVGLAKQNERNDMNGRCNQALGVMRVKLYFAYKGMKLSAVVLIVIRAVHGPMSHGDDPRAHCPVLWTVGFLGQHPSIDIIKIKPQMSVKWATNKIKSMSENYSRCWNGGELLTSRSFFSHSYCLKMSSRPNSR